MSEEYDRLITDVATNCPSVIPATAEAELITVLRDFLQQTAAWKCSFEMPVVPGHNCYVICPPDGTAIHLLFNVFLSTDPDQRPVAQGGWRMNQPGKIEFATTPAHEELWVAQVSLYPTLDCTPSTPHTLVPANILNEYYDTLLHGVLARLQAQLMKAYTNPQMSLLHSRLYREGRSIAKADIARSHVWGTQQWRYPQATTARVRQAGA